MFETTEERVTRKLNEEKEYLWKGIDDVNKKISSLEKDLKSLEKKAPEHYKEAIADSKKTSFYRNRSEDRFNETDRFVRSIEDSNNYIEEQKEKIKLYYSQLEKLKLNADDALTKINHAEESFSTSQRIAEEHIASLSSLVEEKEVLSIKMETLSELIDSGENLSSRLKNMVSNANKERAEIQEAYRDIYGYTYEDDNGDEQQVEGLVKKLEISFNYIKNDLTTLSSELDSLKENQNKKLLDFETQFRKRTEDLIYSADRQRKGLVEKIASLLPSALTAGLSGAYVDKIKVEKSQLDKHEKTFNRAIWGLIICSSIPVVFNAVRVYQGETFSDIVKDIPIVLSMMLPVYAPILWVAYSSNKGYKLSKRLIEEYTHKEVLSKTFEGLSTQIANIGEDDASSELKTRLLHNLLQVNSENPGKLISDYRNTDHPILDAIDKSSKLTDAIDKLENIPLISTLLKHISAKEKAKFVKNKDEIEATLDVALNISDNKKVNGGVNLDS
ncbi:hypothetical protein LPR20_003479 [Vibrio mimicus]